MSCYAGGVMVMVMGMDAEEFPCEREAWVQKHDINAKS